MKFDTPATTNPIDQLKVVGKPTDRIDGPRKTTGKATYAYEHHAAVPNAAYGYILGAAIAKGRIARIDLKRANASPGVLGIVTYENVPRIAHGPFYIDRTLAGPEVDHYHQAVAIVVAETFEQARAASQLIRVRYTEEPGSFDLGKAKDTAVVPKAAEYVKGPETAVGDFEGAFAAAPVQLDATYTTPGHTHCMMEPHATIAEWKGDQLTLWTSVQQLNWGLRDLGIILGIPKENIHMLSPFIGGSFGGKGTVLSDAVLASLAARKLGRPVKVAMSRPMMTNNQTYRAATIQRFRIGTTKEGRITAIGHESWSGNLPGGRPEMTPTPTKVLYAGENRMTRVKLARLDLTEGSSMRAPGESTGMMTLEIAMDEMAEKLGLDPIEFRILNDTQVNPSDPKKPFSQRHLVECLRDGAKRFGWEKRNPHPGLTRDGRWLVGIGVASAVRGSPSLKSAARVTLRSNGSLLVETDMTDVGTGSYTILAQTAAEMMGLTLAQVEVVLGDSRLPESPGSGGQWGAASCTAGVYAACTLLRQHIVQAFGYSDAATFADGMVHDGERSRPLANAAANAPVAAEDTMEYGELSKQYEQDSFGAHFVEVGVDAFTGEVRIRRMLAVCAAGRIMNPKAARNQIMGGMTMGAGAALMEELVVDTNRGYFVNHDLAGYEVPVHADIPHQEVVFLEELDPTISPSKGKGVGELGISGAAAAVANAIYHATGIRVRDYPITLDKLLDKLPEAEAV